MNQTKLDPLSR